MLLASLIFVVYIVLNLGAVSKAVLGGDSGNIILSYYFGSAAHPPGYPLNTLLGYVFTSLLPGSTFAAKASLVSLFYHSIALVLIFFCLRVVTKNIYVSLAATFTLGFTVLFWLYSHVAEVFELTEVLLLASTLFLLRWYLGTLKRRKFSDLFFAFVFWGFAVFHHHISLLFAPAILYLLLKNKKSVSRVSYAPLKLFLGFFLGIVPYFYIVIVDFFGIPTNWGDPSSFGGLVKMITRADYGTFTASPELIGFSAKARLIQILWFVKTLVADFTLIGILLSAVGATYLLFKKRDLFIFLALAFFFFGPFFIAYSIFPPLTSFLQGITERFLLNSYLFFTFFVAFGFLFVFEKLISSIKILIRNSALSKVIIGLSFLAFPLYLALLNWGKTDLSEFDAGDALPEDVINSVDVPGIILLQTDTITFSVQYKYYVEKMGNESKIVMSGRTKHKFYRDKLAREYPELKYPESYAKSTVLSYEEGIKDFIEANYDNRPIYSAGKISVSDNFVWIPQGAVFRLYRRGNLPPGEEIIRKIDSSFSKFRFRKEMFDGRYLSFFEDHIKTIYAEVFVDNAKELLARGQLDRAYATYDTALALSPANRGARFGLAVVLFEKKQCKEAETLFNELIVVQRNYWQAWEGLSKVYADCYLDNDKAKIYREKSNEIKEKQRAIPIN